MFYPNFTEFYHKGLIPIGKQDQKCLNTTMTNWLIALEGECTKNNESIYHWKVSVYLADDDGTFLFSKPFYTSPAFHCIHSAFAKAKDLEDFGKNDMLTSIHI